MDATPSQRDRAPGGPHESRATGGGTPAPRPLRLFIALKLPPAWAEELANVQRRLDRAAPGFGRWVDPSLFHLTLVFLGDQPESALPTIGRAIGAAASAASPFQLAPGRSGSFARGRELAVVWMSVEPRPGHALTTLRGRLVAALEQSGLSYAPTPFSPHITLARARRDANPEQHSAMARAVGNASWDVPPEPFICRDVVLMRSDLRPGGPNYTPLVRRPLGSEPPSAA
jgi:2'-5' RNA ligase